MGFELQFQGAFQAVLITQVIAPPGIYLGHQCAADLCGVFFSMRALEPDKSGVGVAVDHRIAFGFDQRTGAGHDLVAAQGDGGGQARIEEAATAGAEHAVEGVHDDFQRLRQRRVVLAFGRLTALPYALDNRRQAMLASGETRTAKTRY